LVSGQDADVRKAAKPIIGITGGIGSGKSTVASILEGLGAGVIASDRLNHEELNAPGVVKTLRKWWGETVVTPDGRAHRDAIRRIVREDPAALKKLERLVHPRIARRSAELIAAYQADPQRPAIVWDAPLLYEARLAPKCDVVIFVEADADVRLGRLEQSRGWTRADLERLEKYQKPLDFKRAKADYIIENNSDRVALHPQVKDVFSRILSGT
jgi:dephospho-CoA kinase